MKTYSIVVITLTAFLAGMITSFLIDYVGTVPKCDQIPVSPMIAWNVGLFIFSIFMIGFLNGELINKRDKTKN